jgi:hypothetical protein
MGGFDLRVGFVHLHGWFWSMGRFGPCVGLVHGYIGSIGSMDWFGPWMELMSFPEWYSSAQ